MKKYRSIYAADFETDNETSSIFLCTFLKIYNNTIEVPLSKNEEIVSVKNEFWSMINDIIDKNFKNVRDKTRNNEILIYFTNGARFDSYFIKGHLFENDYRQILYATKKTWNDYELRILENGKTGIKNLIFKYKGVIFTIQDFKLHVNLSVKQKGLVVGIDKGTYKNLDYTWISKGCNDCEKCSLNEFEKCSNFNEIIWENVKWINFNEAEKNAMIYYAKKDALIDGLYIQKHISTLGWPRGLTASSNAWKLAERAALEYEFKHNCEIKLYIPNENVWLKHLEGGFNYCNPFMLFKSISGALEWDENGMYGYNMTQPLPYDEGKEFESFGGTKLLRINLKNFSLKEEYRKSIGQGIIKANFAYHKDFEYNFLNKSFPLSGKNLIIEKWEAEWKWIQKMYNIEFEIINIKYFGLKPFWKHIITHLNNERDQLKILCEQNINYAINYILQLDAKLKINSFYGKTTENDKHESYYYSKIEYNKNDIISCEKSKYDLVVTGKSNSLIFGNYKYICQTAKAPEKRKNLYIGSYVTMLGRIRMYEHLITGNIARIDTDGLTSFNNYRPQNIGKNLGQMKLETKKMKKYFMLIGYKAYLWSANETYNKLGLTFKGIQNLKIPKGTPWKNINWTLIEGQSINSVKTESGVNLKRVNKKLIQQAIYINALKKES